MTFEHSSPPLARLRAALAQDPPAVHVYMPEVTHLAIPVADDFAAAGRRWRITAGSAFPRRIDVLLLTAHGADLMAPLWNLRRQLPAAFCMLWLFDNHLAPVQNARTVSVADGYFASHRFCMGNLVNPHSVLFGHVAACCSHWHQPELAAGLAAGLPRSDKFLAGFVDYPFSPRREFLQRLVALPQGRVRLMQPGDRRAYFGMTRAERIAEWCGHKTSVVAPVARDLSTRFFIGLATGQIPLVSDDVLDLDVVVPPSAQAALPVLRYRADDVESLLAAHAEALRLFDAEGEVGIRRRHEFVATGHMVQHRLAQMLSTLVALDSGAAVVAYDQTRGGLMLTASQPGSR